MASGILGNWLRLPWWIFGMRLADTFGPDVFFFFRKQSILTRTHILFVYRLTFDLFFRDVFRNISLVGEEHDFPIFWGGVGGK